jgi:dTDP-4-amino-4,6-dideoxygalactose transaminase
VLGFNSRLDELQAAFLSVKLPHLDGWNDHRRQIAEVYTKAFSQVPELTIPRHTGARIPRVAHLPAALHRSGWAASAPGTGWDWHPDPLPDPTAPFRGLCLLGYKQGDFPIAESIAQTELSLPISPVMTMNEAEAVVGAVWTILADPMRFRLMSIWKAFSGW